MKLPSATSVGCLPVNGAVPRVSSARASLRLPVPPSALYLGLGCVRTPEWRSTATIISLEAPGWQTLPVGAGTERVVKRYAKITGKMPREIVLLRSLPCEWSKCSFCDYIDDNTTDEAEIRRVADEELAKVTGEFGRLEVINSASIQELPKPVQEQIRDLIAAKGIAEFICESHWAYRGAFDETRAFFGVPTRIKVGVETFNTRLRNEVLGKGMHFDSPDDVARVTDTICLLVGFRGQTHNTIRRDIGTSVLRL